MSIPAVSDTPAVAPYHWQMENDSWKGWGPRFKKLAKENGETLATIAEKMGLAESTLRHWTNGTREINLTDLMRMCKAARVHPSLVLFEGPPMNAETKRQIGELAKNALDSNPGMVPGYQKISVRSHFKRKGA